MVHPTAPAIVANSIPDLSLIDASGPRNISINFNGGSSGGATGDINIYTIP